MINDIQIKYLAFFIIIIFFIYYFLYLSKQQFKLIESLTNNSYDSETFANDIKESTNKMTDTLLVSKYRDNYENIIINLEEWCNAKILSTILDGSIDIKSSGEEEIINSMKKINEMENFKNNLNSSMKFLDSQ